MENGLTEADWLAMSLEDRLAIMDEINDTYNYTISEEDGDNNSINGWGFWDGFVWAGLANYVRRGKTRY